MQAKDVNHARSDPIDAIKRKDYPRWDLYVQLLKAEQLGQFDFDALDATKIWPGIAHTKVGTMTLHRNPANIFPETEQSGFAPSNVVPAIEPSADRLLHGRVFSYADTKMYRIGANALQLPLNRARVEVASNNQDGAMNAGARTGNTNDEPSTPRPLPDNAAAKFSLLPSSGSTRQQRIAKTPNYRHAGEFYRSLSPAQQQNLVAHLAGDPGQAKKHCPDGRHIQRGNLDCAGPGSDRLPEEPAQQRRPDGGDVCGAVSAHENFAGAQGARCRHAGH